MQTVAILTTTIVFLCGQRFYCAVANCSHCADEYDNSCISILFYRSIFLAKYSTAENVGHVFTITTNKFRLVVSKNVDAGQQN